MISFIATEAFFNLQNTSEEDGEGDSLTHSITQPLSLSITLSLTHLFWS
jgi:hypothetical protein